MRYACHLIAPFLALLLLSCGPKITVQPPSEMRAFTSFALLPIQASQGISADRVNYVKATLGSELRSRGLPLVDDIVVTRICGDADCAAKVKLRSDYNVDGFIALKLDSISRANFLAGYYNTISGSLSVTDHASQTAFSVQHTERERGGLLFNSGQIIQGFVSQIENSGELSFTRLANKFAASLVATLPSTLLREGGNAIVAPVQIHSVNAREIRPEVHEICASGTPGVLAHVLLGQRKTNLREVESGNYCGVYRLDESQVDARNIAVELRSPYGVTDRRPLKLQLDVNCLPEGGVRLVRQGLLNRLEASCLSVAGQYVAGADCKAVESCAVEKLLVYRAEQQTGPYRKVGEIRQRGWTDISANVGKPFHYQVVSVSRGGGFSAPLSVK